MVKGRNLVAGLAGILVGLGTLNALEKKDLPNWGIHNNSPLITGYNQLPPTRDYAPIFHMGMDHLGLNIIPAATLGFLTYFVIRKKDDDF